MTRYPLTTPRSFLRDPVIMATIAVNGAVLLLNLFPLLEPGITSLLLESYALVPISILAMVAPWIALPATRGRRETVFWGLWSLSLFFHLVVRVLYLVVPEIDSIASGSLGVDILYVFFYLPLVLSLLIRPDWPWLRSEGKVSQLLEYAGAGIFVVSLLGYFILIPRALNRPEYDTWVPSLLMYWILDLYLLITLLFLRQTSPSRDWRILYTWLAVATGCWVITDFVELDFYRNWEGGTWGSGPEDVLWYFPWIAITLAGRMRTHPVPAFLGFGGSDVADSELSRSLGRPGWLQLMALTLPLVHIAADTLGFLDPGTEGPRETVVLLSLILLLGVSAFHQRITERQAVKLSRKGQALEKEQRLLAAAVEQSPDAILIANGDGMVRYANQEYENLCGPVNDVLGRPLLEALPREIQVTSGGDPSVALAEERAWEGRGQTAGRRGDREEVVTVSPVNNQEGEVTHWIMIRKDVTYLTQLERQFDQARRMEAVGPLAAGFADEFNALVRQIYGRGEALKKELSPSTSPYREVESLLDTTERASELVNQILGFTGTSEASKELVSLDEVARDALALLGPAVPENVRVIEKVPAKPCMVLGHTHQIRQMIVNLGTNAIDAMRETGGVLEVGVDDVTLDDTSAEGMGLRHGGVYARLTVKDTGLGIDAESVSRILDPFFTTKDTEEGSGLGLYLVRETVARHQGAIQVESEPGWGSLFRIFLPAAEAGASSEHSSREAEG